MGFRKMLGIKGGSSSKPPFEETKKTKAAAEKTINAIGDLNENEERLEKKRALLEKKMGEELQRAKEYSQQKKKSQALTALKKKKMYEAQLEQTNNLILRLNEQKLMLEGQSTTADVLKSMHTAATAAKQTMQELDINDVDDLVSKIQDQNDEMAQVQEALAQPTGMMNELDDDELLGELDGLEAELLDEELMAPAHVPAAQAPAAEASTSEYAAGLPAAPVGAAAAPAKATNQVEEELAALEAELAA
ncbi:unnamed protein product [Ostreobium quekettii]|uniref:Uncharacterized protein n=1 Tax=Ostreobium quekettii TaxID=121088 RepID=A0A8S1J3G3_9CHLO|nr:unnamed protein product [Ostreobium quekettii]|eukprot:evm.model.scf_3292.1 EVM.evm.TU.scf_3292.1   scf_3292:1998-4305(+)